MSPFDQLAKTRTVSQSGIRQRSEIHVQCGDQHVMLAATKFDPCHFEAYILLALEPEGERDMARQSHILCQSGQGHTGLIICSMTALRD